MRNQKNVVFVPDKNQKLLMKINIIDGEVTTILDWSCEIVNMQLIEKEESILLETIYTIYLVAFDQEGNPYVHLKNQKGHHPSQWETLDQSIWSNGMGVSSNL